MFRKRRPTGGAGSSLDCSCMAFRFLFRRRAILLPTVWGWLAILFAGAAGVAFLGAQLHGFLAVHEPVGGKLLVVEGWIGPRGLHQAVAAFRAGGYERAVTTGGPIKQWPRPPQATYAELAADYLRHHGLADVPVTAVPAPEAQQERTYRSAVLVREWAQRSGIAVERFDVYSQGTHARRSRLLYQFAFGRAAVIGVHAARSEEYDADAWWRSSSGTRDVLEQAVEYLWVRCCFRRAPPEASARG